MTEIATFMRIRSGDLTISGVFPGKTWGGAKASQAIKWMHARSDRLIAWPIFPEKLGPSSPADMAPPVSPSVP
jgi:hypothetical protein